MPVNKNLFGEIICSLSDHRTLRGLLTCLSKHTSYKKLSMSIRTCYRKLIYRKDTISTSLFGTNGKSVPMADGKFVLVEKSIIIEVLHYKRGYLYCLAAVYRKTGEKLCITSVVKNSIYGICIDWSKDGVPTAVALVSGNNPGKYIYQAEDGDN